jgi:RimJ/RimL family protein N-acetyltransferase
MTAAHAQHAAHARATSRDFGLFSKMDVSFWKLFFTNIVHDPATISYVAIDQTNDRLAGYIIGTTNSSKMTRLLLQKLLFPLLWYGLKMLILHPSQIKLVLRHVFARKNHLTIPEQRWITWVVVPAYRKHGLGLELYKRLCSEMHSRGVNEFYGPVDCENVASNKAHEKIKAEIVGTIIVDGRQHYLWKHSAAQWNSE